MPNTLRPRRSVLYMPSSNERALAKAKTLPVDALILDLEDAVAPDAKEQARELACAAATSGEYGLRELVIRINGIGSPWHTADMVAACQAGPAAILVPKVSSASDVRLLVKAMEDAEAPEHTKLWAMVETPAGMLHCAEIAAASPRLTCLVMGTNDLGKELGALPMPGREPLMTGLGLCLLAARAHGKTIIDGVYNDVKDADGFAAECRQGRQWGFDGKTLIHPGQIDMCNEVFSPSSVDIEDAHGIIEAFEAAKGDGKGVATYKGRLIENLHVDTARKVLALDARITEISSGE